MIGFRARKTSSYAWSQRTATAAYAPRDGARIIAIGTRIYLLGGWNPGYAPFVAGGWTAGTTNEIWYSDDYGATWTMLLPQDSATVTRWKPRHEFGCVVANGYVYVIGGDSNSGVCQTDVWRAPTSDLTSWTRMASNWGLGSRVLFSCWTRSGVLYVSSGQTIKSLTGEDPETFFNDTWSSNDGATWTQIATNSPLQHKGACGVASFRDRIFFVAGGRYKSEFTNSVLSTTDGVNFITHTAGPFDARYYTDCAVFDGALWMLGGYSTRSRYNEVAGSDASGLLGYNRCDAWKTRDGESWSRQDAPFAGDNDRSPFPLTHASSVVGLPDRLIIAAGNHLTKENWQLARAA